MAKRWQICLLITALVSWEITIILAISVAWIVPFYYFPPGGNDTSELAQIYAEVLATCAEIVKQQTRTDIEKIHVEAKKHKNQATWVGLSAVIYPKYADDNTNTYVEYGTTAALLNLYHAIAGTVFFENELLACKTNNPPVVCNQLFRLKYRCATLRIECAEFPTLRISKYILSTKWPLVIVRLSEPYSKTSQCNVYTFMRNGIQRGNSVYYARWEPHLRYGSPKIDYYYAYNSSACVKNRKTFVSTSGVTSRIVKNDCWEVLGFELYYNDSYIFQIASDDIKSWVTNCTNIPFDSYNRTVGTVDALVKDPQCVIEAPTCGTGGPNCYIGI